MIAAHCGADGQDDVCLPAGRLGLQDGHHQRVYDADGSNGKRQAAENPEEHVEHSKELAHTPGRIDDGESAESHLLDFIFDGRNLIRVLYSHAD